MPQVKVNLDGRSYPVIIGHELEDRLVSSLKKQVGSNRLFVFYDANFYALHGRPLSKLLKRNFDYSELVVPSGEKSKSKTELNRIHDYLLGQKISRTDFILVAGGGVASDLIGYAAATVLRSVPFGILSTTLLGMVDASIGGKTGINHKSGKNLIGAFYQPKFVISDVKYLMTLPEREFISGLGEVLKYAGLIGDKMAGLLEKYMSKANLYDISKLQKIITLAAGYKASIVEQDEKESGQRMYLNLGHTIGHAIEQSLGYKKLKHGEAVIMGLWAALYLSLRYRKHENRELYRFHKMIDQFFSLLPSVKLEKRAILKALSADKKQRNQKMNFILLDRPGKPIIKNNIKQSDIELAVARLLETYKNYGVGDA